MIVRAFLVALLLAVSLLCFAQAAQPDYAREKRWADEITPAILVGDPVYGKKRSIDPLLGPFPRQALHAERLEFQHPASDETVAWQAPAPPDMGALLAALKAQA